VIHPMLVDVIRTLGPGPDEVWAGFREPLHRRARRYAAVLERLVSPEGTLPPIGRSLAYRFGALQALAQAVLHQDLPEELPAAQARGAMAAAIERMIHAPGTFDADGYLRIGFCGHQPSIGEGYISTGSLYLCANAFLPLGLGVDQAFWADPPTPWTQVRIYGGEDLPADHAAG